MKLHHGIGMLAATLAVAAPTRVAACPESELAEQILGAAGVRGGLVVHLGCGDGKLTAALHAGGGFLVQGLDTDLKNIEVARKHIGSAGLYGPVAVAPFSGERLPFIDNVANLVVSEDVGRVSREEILRVLAPGGVAYLKGRDGEWAKTPKPRPKDIDEWTHYLHGADNNAVADDRAVDAPYHIQWIGEPRYSRSHQYLTSVSAMVSSGGRVFYIADEGPTELDDFTPAAWSLSARDAFNGVLLWNRPISSWQPANQKGRLPFPPDLYRRLVAVGDRVYATLDIFGPVSALDAATGKTLRTYEGTDRTEEILCDGGTLFCVATLEDPSAIDRRQAALARVQPRPMRIVAISADTGNVLWTKQDADTTGYLPLTLASKDGRLVFQNPEAIVCVDAKTGSERWRYARQSVYARVASSTPTLVIQDGVVLNADSGKGTLGRKGKDKGSPGELIALAADTGRELWRSECAEGVASPVDVLVINGQVWVGEVPKHKELDFRETRDLHTGEVRKEFGAATGWVDWHHHRCYREKATRRYLLAARTGVEFIDCATGSITPHNWIRGICRYGVLPCNGLLYLPPDQCACYIQSKLDGFNALAPRRKGEPASPRADEERLARGPAYGAAAAPSGSRVDSLFDWPTFRHDAARSSCTPSTVGSALEARWNAALGGKLSSLTAADGRLYVCQVNAHAVVCLDATTGKILWRYIAGGRVDSPPTIADGVAVFGCRDGHVYALRATDGELIWRFRAAPDDRRLVAFDQIESVWPVHGGVMVEGGAVYFAAGRNSYIDGGVWLHKLDLATGRVLVSKNCYSRDPDTGAPMNLFPPFQGEILPDREMPGVLPDVFSGNANGLYLRSVELTRDLEIVGNGKAHLFCSKGLLDDSSWERTYWLYGTHMYGGARGWGAAQSLEPAGRIITFDDARAYGFKDATFPTAELWAAAKEPERIAGKTAGKPRKKKAGRKQAPADDEDHDLIERGMTFAYAWRAQVPLNVRAMVIADQTLFIAGPPRFDEAAALESLEASRTDDATLPPPLAEAAASLQGRKGCILWAVSKTDGKKIAELKLDSAPIFDGMIAADGNLYLATLDGRIVCLRGKPPEL